MKKRQTSVELLRVIAMLMVMTLHVNFAAVGDPNSETILTSDGIIRTVVQMLCICAVNTFVMISGWFGIRPTIKGFANFMWQVFYFVGLATLINHFVLGQPVGFRNVLQCFGLFGGGGWFVAAYIGLYILAPVLNAYLANTSPRNISLLLIGFLMFELLWGNSLSVTFIVGGYSTLSFIAIYLLAGLLRKLQLSVRSTSALLIFIACVFANSLMYIATKRFNLVAVTPMITNYINPLVITSAASLLIIFANMSDPKSQKTCTFINWLGASCFAAYLFHVTTPLYLSTASNIVEYYTAFDGICVMLCFIFVVFIGAVILDQPRKLIWQKLLNPIFSKLTA